ncbi:MAG TPA: hypothetical protein VKZ53_16735 [Candidatus Angelobacter sp.]|nr:hypothetical protein [Candidatus Angelobacter sp.]
MNSLTRQRRRQSTPEEREGWISRFRSSGLSQAHFAEQNGLKLKTLQRWLYGRGAHAAPMGKPSASGDHSHRIGRKAVVICRKPRRAPSPTFQEVKLPPLDSASAGWVAEVAWPSGVTVCFGAGAEAAWIGALLETVRQAC